MFFDGSIKPKEYSLNEEKFPVNNYANMLSFLINENNYLNDFLLLDIYPLMEEAIIFDDEIMFSESIADNIAFSISSLKKTVKKVEELWSKFVSDYESNRQEVSKLITQELMEKDLEGYVYYGYTYHIKYDNIYVDHSLVNNGNLIARQLTHDRVEQLKRYYNEHQHYDRMRGQFISQPTCSADDFPKELKRYYRNGRAEPTEMPLTDELRERMVSSIKGTDSILESCKSIKDSILIYCKTALTYLEEMHKLTQVSKSGILDSRAIGFKLSDIEELASVQVKNIRTVLSIYLTALTVKMDMCNERQRYYTRALKDLSEGGEE